MTDHIHMQKRDWLWVTLTILFAVMWLKDSDDISQKVIEERDQQIAKCRAVQEQHARAITTLLDRGGVLFVAGEPVTMCKRKS